MANPVLEKAGITNTESTPKSTKSLAAVEDALRQSTVRSVEMSQALQNSMQATEMSTEVIKTAVQDITQASQTIQLTKDNAALKAQNATIDAVKTAVNPDAQKALIETLNEDHNRVQGLLDQRADILDDEHTGISIIDNIINQFRTFQTDVNLGEAERQLAATENQVASLHAATESITRINAATAETVNEGTIEANQKLLAASGNKELAETEIKNIQTNASSMLALANADQNMVQNRLSVYRLEGEAENRELQRERVAFQREQMAVDREKWETQLPLLRTQLDAAQEELQEFRFLSPARRNAMRAKFEQTSREIQQAEQFQRSFISSVQAGQSLMGIPIEDEGTILSNYVLTQKNRDKYIRLQELGGVSDPRIGQDAYEAKKNLVTTSPSGNYIPTPGTKALDEISVAQANFYKEQEATGGLKRPKDEATIKADFNATAKAYMGERAREIATGDSSNPYHAAPMEALTGFSKAIQNDPFYRKVLKNFAMKETNPQSIMDAGIAGIRAGTVTPEEVANGITTIFDVAADYNNSYMGGFRRVGLDNQVSYNVNLQRPMTALESLGLAGRAATAAVPSILTGDDETVPNLFIKSIESSVFSVDLMNPTDVQNAVVRLLSATSPKGEGED